MTDEQLAQIKARVDAATPGPWVISTGYRGFVPGRTIFQHSEHGGVICKMAEMGPGASDVTTQFITHARTDIPALLAEVERLRGALNEIFDHADERSWSHVDYQVYVTEVLRGDKP